MSKLFLTFKRKKTVKLKVTEKNKLLCEEELNERINNLNKKLKSIESERNNLKFEMLCHKKDQRKNQLLGN